ncbi:MAG: signal peptide peptidase SppA [Pseudomonadota bacterium]
MTKSYFYRPKQEAEPQKPKRWNIGKIIVDAVKKTCMAVGALILFSATLSTCAVIVGGNAKAPLPNDVVLVFHVEQNIAETQTRPSLFEPFPFMQPTLQKIIHTLEVAKDDDRVRGIVFSLKGGGVSITHAQDLREAIIDFRESGKFAKIYAPSYAESAGSFIQYYLATAFDEIWMQPVGMMSITGLSFEMPFLKETFDKIGVNPQFVKREEYKSAVENFTNAEISPENEETLSAILDSWTDHITKDIASSREIDASSLLSLINKGLLTGEEALQANLIDRLDYADRIISEIRQEATGDEDDESVKLISLAEYGSHHRVFERKANNLALIYVSGQIVASDRTGSSAGATEIVSTIEEAIKDDSIKGIVVRIDSPGGSPSASETIRRALEKAKSKDKPVIISMGSMAASGGYWIASEGNRIYASQGTLTGSIGVVMGKFELSGLWDEVDVNWQGPQFGENSDLWSINRPFDSAALSRINTVIDSTYEDFLQRVAKGRNLPMQEVQKIAKGRAYTGEDAFAVGLVDEIGNLDFALEKAALMIGAKSLDEVGVIRLPRELNGVERLFQLVGQEVVMPFFPHVIEGHKPLYNQIEMISNEMALLQESPVLVYDPLVAALSQ